MLVEARANNPVQKAAAVPLNWSFLNGLLNHVVKELNIEEVLKSPIFVVQKAAAPKNGVEFCQGSNGTIRNILTTLYDVARLLLMVPIELCQNATPFFGAAAFCTTNIDNFRR